MEESRCGRKTVWKEDGVGHRLPPVEAWKPVSQEPSSKMKIPHNQQAGGLLVMGDFFLVSVIPLRMIFASSGTKSMLVTGTHSIFVRVTNFTI